MAYDPTPGRWMMEDPTGLEDDTNTYRYVKNNPTNSKDPSGLAQVLGFDRQGNVAMINWANPAGAGAMARRKPPVVQPGDPAAAIMQGFGPAAAPAGPVVPGLPAGVPGKVEQDPNFVGPPEVPQPGDPNFVGPLEEEGGPAHVPALIPIPIPLFANAIAVPVPVQVAIGDDGELIIVGGAFNWGGGGAAAGGGPGGLAFGPVAPDGMPMGFWMPFAIGIGFGHGSLFAEMQWRNKRADLLQKWLEGILQDLKDNPELGAKGSQEARDIVDQLRARAAGLRQAIGALRDVDFVWDDKAGGWKYRNEATRFQREVIEERPLGSAYMDMAIVGSFGPRIAFRGLAAVTAGDAVSGLSLPIRISGPTHGLLRTPSGETLLSSGVQGPARLMPSGSRGFDIVTRTHAEGHGAALMQQQGIQQATVHINNYIICPNCMRNLPGMLAPGSRLTVVSPSGTSITFVGRIAP